MREFATEHALICCRISDKKQLKGSGLDSQEHRCLQHAENNGYIYEKTFFAAKSGGLPLLERPEIQDLLAHIDGKQKERKKNML